MSHCCWICTIWGFQLEQLPGDEVEDARKRHLRLVPGMVQIEPLLSGIQWSDQHLCHLTFWNTCISEWHVMTVNVIWAKLHPLTSNHFLYVGIWKHSWTCGTCYGIMTRTMESATCYIKKHTCLWSYKTWCQDIPDGDALPTREDLISSITFHSTARGLWFTSEGKQNNPDTAVLNQMIQLFWFNWLISFWHWHVYVYVFLDCCYLSATFNQTNSMIDLRRKHSETFQSWYILQSWWLSQSWDGQSSIHWSIHYTIQYRHINSNPSKETQTNREFDFTAWVSLILVVQDSTQGCNISCSIQNSKKILYIYTHTNIYIYIHMYIYIYLFFFKIIC